MLKKNVYILYPPGYSGSYINWAINASDLDLQKITVPNPVNGSTSKQLGGAGTSHLHTRIPTHQGVEQHLTWVLYNRPTECKVYIINAANESVCHGIIAIAQHDPDGVFINIHNRNDDAVDSYGTINCVTKWPTYIDIMLASTLDTKYRETVHKNFDPYNCAEDRLFRNWAVKNDSTFFRHNRPLDVALLTKYQRIQRDWYRIRNQAQPHEVNEETYIPSVDLNNRVFELSCLDVCREDFPQWLENFLQASKVSTNYNCELVERIHPEYISAQPNLQWFESFEHWKSTGELDNYLTSHSAIEAQIIKHIFKCSNRIILNNSNRDTWVSFYSRCRGPDWPDAETEYDYFDLPEWVKKEIIEFGYKFNLTVKPNPVILTLDWESMSLSEINDVYQQSK